MPIYIIFALLIFGILIIVHEAGHFAAAKLLGAKVNEFAVGMGPCLFSRRRGETDYSLRAFPVGGFCAMEGEDEDSGDPRAFTNQRSWKKFIILLAGSFMNFLIGLLVLVLLYAQATSFVTPVIDGFMEGFPYESETGLLPGDRIIKINGEPIYIYSDVALFLSRSNGETMDLVIERNGQRLERNDFPLKLREYVVDGETKMKYGLLFTVEEATVGLRLQQSWFNALDFVRLVRMGLVDLITGAVGLQELSGPIGIVNTISQVGAESATAMAAARNILYYGALIAVNLAVMNLLPLPALDGGRIFFLLVNSLFMLLTRHKINPKYEGYIHAAGLFCLLALMVVVAFNDIAKIVAG
jgi:regulator of sigma E protease